MNTLTLCLLPALLVANGGVLATERLASPLPLDSPHVPPIKAVLDLAFAPLPQSYDLSYYPPKRALEAMASGLADGDISRIAEFGQLLPGAIQVKPHLSTSWLYLLARRSDVLPETLQQIGESRLAYTHGIITLQQRTEGLPSRETAPDDVSCMQKVLAQRVRYCLLFNYRPPLDDMLQPYASKLRWRRFDPTPIYLWLAPGKQELADQLGWQLQRMLRSGRLQQLMGPFR